MRMNGCSGGKLCLLILILSLPFVICLSSPDLTVSVCAHCSLPVASSFVRTCQKTVDSSCWWGHVSTSSRPTRTSSPLIRVTSSAWLVRRTVAGGRGRSMARMGGFLATMSVRSKALVGTPSTSVRHYNINNNIVIQISILFLFWHPQIVSFILQTTSC